MSSYLYNMMYGSASYSVAPYVVNRVSPFAAIAGAMVSPSAPATPTPKQFVQEYFPLPLPSSAPTMTVESNNARGGKDITSPGTIISSETETFPGSQTFTSQDKGLTIGPVVPATLDQLQQAQAYSSASIMKPSTYPELFGSKVFGMTPTYNKATGQVRATAPNVGLFGAGMLSPFVGLGSAMMQNKIETAALNAAMGEKGNGVFTLNGMTIALVDGKISGNIKALEDQGYSYQAINNFVNSYAEQQGDPTKFGGRYTEARAGVERTAANPEPYGTPTQTYSSSELGFGTTGSMSEAGRPTGFVSGSQGGNFGTGAHKGEKDGPSGAAGAATGPGSGASTSAGSGWGGMVFGGRVGMANGDLALNPGQAGFVDGPPEQFTPSQTVADDKPISVPEGSFIINAPAVEVAGSQDIKKMLMEAYTVLGKKVDKAPTNTKILSEEEVDILISSGEVVVPPELAGIIGYDRLRKINNRGKDEVARRQAESEQQGGRRSGGFISGYANGDIVGDVGEEIPYETNIPLPKSTRKKFEAYLKRPKNRQSVEQFIDSLTDKEKLVVLGLAETTASKDPIESMMGVGQVAINRAKSNRPDFVNVNDLGAVMKQRSNRGSGSKMFQYDGLEPKFLYPRIQEIVEGRSPTAVSKTFMAAENLLDPETEFDPILPFDVMFYTDPNAPLAEDFKRNPMMQYYTSMSGHDYYSLMAAPELP